MLHGTLVLRFGSWDLHFQHLWAPRGHGRIDLCSTQPKNKSGKVCEDVGMHDTVFLFSSFLVLNCAGLLNMIHNCIL